MTKSNSQNPTNASYSRHLKLGVATAALAFLIGSAQAQESEPAQAEPEAEQQLDKVVVTATKREGVTELEVPLAISAYDFELLEDVGILDASDLEQLSPSLQFTQGESLSSGTSVSIRGIGTGSNDFGFEPSVGIFIDGVLRTRTGTALSDLPELSSAEIIRGPQGTLFGRNTSSGVVSIQTAGPEDQTRSTLGISLGNLDATTFNLTTTGAWAEGHASRLDISIRERDGYITDENSNEAFNGIARWSGRFQHLWTGNQGQSLRFIADYSEASENCCAAVQASGPLDPLLNQLALAAPLTGSASQSLVGTTGTGNLDSDERFNGAFSPNRPYREDIENYGISAEYNGDTRFGRLTSITAYRAYDAVRDQDIDFSGIDRAYRDDQRNQDKTFTQELRLQGENGRLDWLVGAFYLNQKIDTTDTIRLGTQGNEYVDILTGIATNDLITQVNAANGTNYSGFQLFGSLSALTGPVNPVTGTGAPSLLSFQVLNIPGPGGTVIQRPIVIPQLANAFLPAAEEGAGLNDDVFNLDTESIALFTHNVVSLTDRLDLTLGLRYTNETKDVSANLNSTGLPACDALLDPAAADLVLTLGPLVPLICNPAVNPEFNGSYSDSRTDDEFTGTVKLSFAPTQNWNVFGGYSRGYKSGSYNLSRSSFQTSLTIADANGNIIPGATTPPTLSDLEFDSETVDAYEIGFKSSLLDRSLDLSAIAFYQDISDFQENVFNGVNFIVVGSDVESYGLEVSAQYQATEALTLYAAFANITAERKNDVAIGTALLPGGEQLGNTPENVITAQATYEWDLSANIGAFAHANIRWNDEATVSSIDALDPFSNGSFATVGGRIGIHSSQDGTPWELSAFVSNLFEENYNLVAFPVPEQTGQFGIFPAPPRFWGAELKLNF